MTDATDHELIYRAQAGDRLAFSCLIERHYGMMFKVAWQFCGVREDAEDIAQEAAIKIAGHLDAFKFESAFTTWIYRVVINTAKDYYKAKNRRNTREQPIYEDVQYVAHDPTPEQKLQYKDLLQALAELPETLKEAVVLVCWQGLSHKEAAVALECSEGTVSWRIHEARKKLTEFGDMTKKGKSIKAVFWMLMTVLFIWVGGLHG